MTRNNDHLFVVDQLNQRILVFSGASLSNAMPANTVIGQPNFTSNSQAASQTGFSFPSGITYDTSHNHLFIGDYLNHRVLVFSGASLSNGMNATAVLGAANFTPLEAGSRSQW